MLSQVDEYLTRVSWQEELTALRLILLDCGLTEEWKWKQPCYTYRGNNIGILGSFKDNCVFSFFKGVLLQDEHSILEKPGANSQSARVVRITDVKQVVELRPILKAYIFEAIEVEKAGLNVTLESNDNLVFPEELHAKFALDPKFQTAFQDLTPGRQRGYNLYFSGAKSSKSRYNRIEKHTERILAGKGIHDCICGRSQKMPRCDGSHQHIQ